METRRNSRLKHLQIHTQDIKDKEMFKRTLDKKRFFTARFREQRRLKQGNGFKVKAFSVLNNVANLGKRYV